VRSGIDVARYVAYDSALMTPGEVQSGALETRQMDVSWVHQGSPVFQVRPYATSGDETHQSGIWQCSGPKVFEWHFHGDETVYILDGYVRVEYGGHTRELRPGSVAFFPAGSHARWSVPQGVKKAYTISQPSRLRRALRKLFSSPAN
jgi:uncharacterized cupin superfamily protein